MSVQKMCWNFRLRNGNVVVNTSIPVKFLLAWHHRAKFATHMWCHCSPLLLAHLLSTRSFSSTAALIVYKAWAGCIFDETPCIPPDLYNNLQPTLAHMWQTPLTSEAFSVFGLRKTMNRFVCMIPCVMWTDSRLRKKILVLCQITLRVYLLRCLALTHWQHPVQIMWILLIVLFSDVRKSHFR